MHTRHSIKDYVNVVHNGIEKNYEVGKPKKKVIVVGAGLAGLSAA